MRYFGKNLQTFIIIIDGHQTGLGLILTQSETLKDTKPVAIPSTILSAAEKSHPQIDLEVAYMWPSMQNITNVADATVARMPGAQ